MKVTIKKLSVLKHPEKNVRIHSEQQIRELKRSLEKFGQTRALVIDENNIILIGNGLYEAMVSLGYQAVNVSSSSCLKIIRTCDSLKVFIASSTSTVSLPSLLMLFTTTISVSPALHSSII